VTVEDANIDPVLNEDILVEVGENIPHPEAKKIV
jgi:hypothetical protein